MTRPVVLMGGALLVGGALVASLASGPSRSPASQSYRLVLEADVDPVCTYGSAWSDGDVVLPHDNSDGRTVTLTSRYDFQDHCTWEATEVLTPTAEGYDYVYTEHVVECRGDGPRGVACPRRGHVTVVPNL